MLVPGRFLVILLLSAAEYSRALATVEVTVSFSLATDTIAACDQGLTRPGINAALQRRQVERDSTDKYPWQTLGVVHIAASGSDTCQPFSFKFNSTVDEVQFRLVQWEHGGGYCNCWGVVPGSWSVTVGGANVPHLPDSRLVHKL